VTKKKRKTKPAKGKKKPGKGKKKVAKSPPLAWPPSAAAITVELGMPVDPGLMKCRPGSQVALLVLNRDNEPYTVWIDPAKVMERIGPKELKHRNPFELRNQRITVGPRAIGLIRQQLRPLEYFFPKGQTGIVSFKYTVECENAAGVVRELDPDLDVTDPRAAGSG
jgi:hypothetical protein